MRFQCCHNNPYYMTWNKIMCLSPCQRLKYNSLYAGIQRNISVNCSVCVSCQVIGFIVDYEPDDLACFCLNDTTVHVRPRWQRGPVRAGITVIRLPDEETKWCKVRWWKTGALGLPAEWADDGSQVVFRGRHNFLHDRTNMATSRLLKLPNVI